VTNIRLTLYGIPHCESVKKARAWLAEHGLAYQFHDYKKSGVPEARLRNWVSAKGWQTLLNRKGTTWRALAPEAQAAIVDSDAAVALMLAHASAIKRPVIEAGELLIVGWDDAAMEVLAALKVSRRA
jgi:arsenate reductase (glutaredoxin)